jgi:hypothetical protein
MALQAGGSLFWATSTDAGSSWGAWQQVAGATPATTGSQPSLAVLNGTLYLSYLDNSEGINLMSNVSPSGNSWSRPTLVTTQAAALKASSAALVSETVDSKAQLALYFVNATSGSIEKTYTTQPSSSSGWVNALPLSGSKQLTSAGPLRVSQVSSQTYLAYQSSAASETLTIAANSNSNSKTGWVSQTVAFSTDGSSQSGLSDFSIGGGADNLTLTAISVGAPDQLQGQLLTPTLSSSALSLKVQQSSSQTLPDGISSVASVNGQASAANALILVGIPASTSAVTPYTSSVDLSSLAAPQWSPLTPISATSAACNNGSGWSAQTVIAPGPGTTALGPILLSSGESTLSLGYRLAGQAAELLVDTIGIQSPSWSPSTAFTAGASGSPAALVCDGDTVYMALQAGGSLFWATSTDAGSSWGAWQQVAGATPATTGSQPSLLSR